MGWRGAGGGGAASIPSYLFMGGLCQLIGAFLEFFLGNTFSFVVFSTLGGFWLTFGYTLQPSSGAIAAYAATGGQESPQFEASFGTFTVVLETIAPLIAQKAFFLISMAVLCFIYFICSIRTNCVLVFVLACIVIAFALLAATYWQLANGNTALAGKLQMVSGNLINYLNNPGTDLFQGRRRLCLCC